MQGPTGAPGQPGEPVSSFVNTLYCTIDHSGEFYVLCILCRVQLVHQERKESKE